MSKRLRNKDQCTQSLEIIIGVLSTSVGRSGDFDGLLR
jgi:hypothetical protein